MTAMWQIAEVFRSTYSFAMYGHKGSLVNVRRQLGRAKPAAKFGRLSQHGSRFVCSTGTTSKPTVLAG